eukprot:CAMPEP_0115293898 /NCGR_PEP_ID=MMETSP0270-20121206/65902_1 /TAXON_ID=71861 /ORGANISM="Scrippsiella trochoidea, Strain CCMP3099" /LENGTH=31 /DNA_ID= /DNA_START= /DNA_END= /DNA_ORIENTATION=
MSATSLTVRTWRRDRTLPPSVAPQMLSPPEA